MRRVRCGSVSEKDAIADAMWCERPYKEAAEDHLRVTPIRSGRHRYRQKRLIYISLDRQTQVEPRLSIIVLNDIIHFVSFRIFFR